MKPVRYAYPAVSVALLTAGIILAMLPKKGYGEGDFFLWLAGFLCIFGTCCVPLVYIARLSRQKHKQKLLEHNELMKQMKLQKQQNEGTAQEEELPVQPNKRAIAVGIVLLAMPYLLVVVGFVCIFIDRASGAVGNTVTAGTPIGTAGVISLLTGGLLIIIRNLADILANKKEK